MAAVVWWWWVTSRLRHATWPLVDRWACRSTQVLLMCMRARRGGATAQGGIEAIQRDANSNPDPFATHSYFCRLCRPLPAQIQLEVHNTTEDEDEEEDEE
eukprot:scaffold227429_cov40-Tisochrysis_lutea.AAC.1